MDTKTKMARKHADDCSKAFTVCSSSHIPSNACGTATGMLQSDLRYLGSVTSTGASKALTAPNSTGLVMANYCSEQQGLALHVGAQCMNDCSPGNIWLWDFGTWLSFAPHPAESRSPKLCVGVCDLQAS